MIDSDDSQAHGTPSEYRSPFPPKPVAPQAKAAIEALLPPPITRQQLLDLFDGRANYPQAKQWRHGIRRLPHWAAAILSAKLAERMAPLAKLQAQLPEAIGPGFNCDPAGRTLRAWRLKQKAGSKPA